jgi:hypothetical protein
MERADRESVSGREVESVRIVALRLIKIFTIR